MPCLASTLRLDPSNNGYQSPSLGQSARHIGSLYCISRRPSALSPRKQRALSLPGRWHSKRPASFGPSSQRGNARVESCPDIAPARPGPWWMWMNCCMPHKSPHYVYNRFSVHPSTSPESAAPSFPGQLDSSTIRPPFCYPIKLPRSLPVLPLPLYC